MELLISKELKLIVKIWILGLKPTNIIIVVVHAIAKFTNLTLMVEIRKIFSQLRRIYGQYLNLLIIAFWLLEEKTVISIY